MSLLLPWSPSDLGSGRRRRLGLLVSRSSLLLAGGIAGAGEGLVEFGFWRGDRSTLRSCAGVVAPRAAGMEMASVREAGKWAWGLVASSEASCRCAQIWSELSSGSRPGRGFASGRYVSKFKIQFFGAGGFCGSPTPSRDVSVGKGLSSLFGMMEMRDSRSCSAFYFLGVLHVWLLQLLSVSFAFVFTWFRGCMFSLHV